MIKRYFKKFVSVMAGFSPIIAQASTFGAENDVLSKTLDGLIGLLTGGWARGIATLAIISVGYMLLSGKMEKSRAVIIVVGIGVIFSSAYIIQGLSVPTA